MKFTEDDGVEWAAAPHNLDTDDALTNEVARLLRDDAGFECWAENTGGWNYCVLMPDKNTGGLWYWGTADKTWGGSLMLDDGRNPLNLTSKVPSDCTEPGRIALGICKAMLGSDNELADYKHGTNGGDR